MTFREIFIKNFKYQLNQFVSYLFVNSFIVAVLFMYGSLLFNEKLMNNLSMDLVESLISYAAYATILFSIIFITYTSIYFVKSRGKEFGVYLTLGMTTSDLVKLTIFENLMIMIGSIFIGIFTGIIFSKLFYLIIGKVLHLTEDIYYLDYKTFVISLGIFSIIFIFNMLFTSRFIKNLSIIEMTKSTHKKGISESRPLVGCLATFFFLSSLIAFYLGTKGYLKHITFIKQYESVLRPIFIILLLISLYYVITFSLDVITQIMTRFPGLYHRHILILSNLKHRFFSYKVSLYIVTLLISLSIYFIGFGYSTYLFIDENIDQYIPYDFMIESTETHNVITKQEVEDLIIQHNGTIDTFSTLEFIMIDRVEVNEFGLTDFSKKPNIIISESKFNNHLNLDIDLAADELLLVYNEQTYKDTVAQTDSFLLLQDYSNKVNALGSMDNKQLSEIPHITYLKQNINTMVASFINSYGDFDFTGVIANVVDDHIYEQLHGLEKRTVHLFNLASGDEQKINAALINYLDQKNNLQPTHIQTNYAKDESEFIAPINKAEKLAGAFQTTGITFFSVFFLGILFLTSAVIVLYYKIYTDVEDELEQIQMFQKIGLTKVECKTYLTKHITILFFVPLCLGISLGLYFIYVSFISSSKVQLIMFFISLLYILFGILLYSSLRNKFLIRTGL